MQAMHFSMFLYVPCFFIASFFKMLSQNAHKQSRWEPHVDLMLMLT